MDWNQLIGVFTFWQLVLLIVLFAVLGILFIKMTHPKRVGPVEYGATPVKRAHRRKHAGLH